MLRKVQKSHGESLRNMGSKGCSGNAYFAKSRGHPLEVIRILMESYESLGNHRDP